MEKALILVGAIMVIAGMAISILIIESKFLNTHIAVFPIACLVMITGWALIRITLFYSAKNKQKGGMKMKLKITDKGLEWIKDRKLDDSNIGSYVPSIRLLYILREGKAHSRQDILNSKVFNSEYLLGCLAFCKNSGWIEDTE